MFITGYIQAMVDWETHVYCRIHTLIQAMVDWETHVYCRIHTLIQVMVDWETHAVEQKTNDSECWNKCGMLIDCDSNNK